MSCTVARWTSNIVSNRKIRQRNHQRFSSSRISGTFERITNRQGANLSKDLEKASIVVAFVFFFHEHINHHLQNTRLPITPGHVDRLTQTHCSKREFLQWYIGFDKDEAFFKVR